MKSPRSELIFVTPAMAEHWLSHCLYERQRRRAEHHVQRLKIEMEKGRFIAGTQIHFGVINGKLFLVNGQHTLAALVRYGQPLELSVIYTPVESEDELGKLYGRHDRHRSRTPHDAYLGMGLGQELDLPENEINAFGPALKFVLSGFRRISVSTAPELSTSTDLLADEMRKWVIHAKNYFVLAREAPHGTKAIFRRSPVVAVGLVTFRDQKEQAEKFWTGVIQVDGLHTNDPRRVLNAFLLLNASRTIHPITYIKHIATAWNRFMEGAEVVFLRASDLNKIGVTLKGTLIKAQRTSGNEAPDDPLASPAIQMTLGDGAQVH